MGLAHGIEGWALVKATGYEHILILLSALPFFLFVLPVFVTGTDPNITLPLFLLSLSILAVTLNGLFGRWLLRAFCLQLGFLFLSATTFIILMAWVDPSTPLSTNEIQLYGGAYVVAWLIGLVTPGAPAGAGVRELVLIGLLEASMTNTGLLTIVILSRLTTLTGDFIFFVLAGLALDDK